MLFKARAVQDNLTSLISMWTWKKCIVGVNYIMML